MTDYNKYKDYTETDFINDPYFQDWVINPTDRDKQFWTVFLQTYPHKEEEAESAGNFLKKIVFKEELPGEIVINRSLANHLQAIKQLENHPVIDIKKPAPVKRLLGIAAAVGGIILIISALFIFIKKERSVVIKTGYGDLRSVVLPDSSLVMLNANSSITFNKSWGKNKSREVWLEGEAFFTVRHINQDTNQVQTQERFIVHTEEVTVEVLGTSFDIRHRRGKIQVVLETGRIKVSFQDKRMNDIVMQPGDILGYDQEEKKYTTATTSAERFSAWKEKKLQLDNPTTAEIVQYLEDNFGKHIVLDDTELAKRKIEGSILLTNLDDALFILSTVLNAEIIKEDSTITIRPR